MSAAQNMPSNCSKIVVLGSAAQAGSDCSNRFDGQDWGLAGQGHYSAILLLYWQFGAVTTVVCVNIWQLFGRIGVKGSK